MAHSEHHHQPKKAVFLSPLIMGLSFWLFAFFFLSLCDGPAHGHDAEGTHTEAHEQVSTAPENQEKNSSGMEVAAAVLDSSAVDSTKAIEVIKDTLK